ncbi:HAMP domain-containing sensor histidine kinase [Cronbergia sp. UHCC 0137]|uniref:PAS domain-containing sensor histidine kinase n=1 Tax=Cronbergia sp. UHCC 0137 TaxID=3110239 RepID=UPI002B206294|nr:HAMP domain-containing sensor histidine kinase [Cronbergia sp. UHCC 0137]MEA5619761.1 HAMP domain-containing sensor histidine kinase [Cronbergia sp. UHCC 0137]
MEYTLKGWYLVKFVFPLLWRLCMDIISHSQSVDKLRESEERYQALLDAIPDLMFRISRDGEYLDMRGNQINFPLSPAEIIGQNLEDILPSDVAKVGKELIAQTLASKTWQFWEYAIITPIGKRFYQARLVASGNDEVLAIVEDITKCKYATQQSLIYQKLATLNNNLERQVEERTSELKQKMQELEALHRVKDVVWHTVAHDLKTSLMGNLMVLKHLLNSQRCDNSRISVCASVIERMIHGSDRQLGMIDSLLEVHCGDQEGVILDCHLTNFNTLVKEILVDLQPLFCNNQASVINLMSADLPPVMVDAKKLKRVFTNLFTHSLQHNPPGVKFTLNAKVIQGVIRVQIQDHCATMSKHECDRLFDLYVRDPQSPCSTQIGLQMYICRQIIQAHGGEIGAIRKQSQGLNFWFTLPVKN